MAAQYYDYGFAELRVGFEEAGARFLLFIACSRERLPAGTSSGAIYC